ncbi:NPCBM/NEW2 domain-containing protein [Deinococcus oregonensis]|uniref:NPCBM/NEW2 domain-containing protein n=1 Tax=Deinococcus oregonensis TaxID=1805970 RepID=A0ABV6AX81_9DEIO
MMQRIVARSLLFGSALTLWLTGCSQPASPLAADPYAGGTSYPWAYTAPPNQLTPLSLTAGENNLYYEPILAARNSWGPVEIDRSNGEQAAGDGKTLTLNGTTYARGFGTHAGSELRFSLKGTGATCDRFTAQIGVDDEVGEKGSVVFQVYLDGQKAYDSGTMTGASVTKTVNLDISGKQELRLVVTDAGNGISYDHADWAKPLILCQATTPSLTLNQSALSVYHLHTASLKATFASYKAGPIDLQLVADPAEQPPGGTRLPSPVVLQTTSLTLSGAGAETRDLVFAAPEKLGFTNYSSAFHLLVSRNGQLLSRVPVQLTELPINFTASVDPVAVSGRSGEMKTLLLTVTADPPLDQAQPLAVGFQMGTLDGSEIMSVGPVSGDGARMQAAVTFQFGTNPSGPVETNQLDVGIRVGEITTGYRDAFYGSRPSFHLLYTLLP